MDAGTNNLQKLRRTVWGHCWPQIFFGGLNNDLEVEGQVLVLRVWLLVFVLETSIGHLPHDDAQRIDVGLVRVFNAVVGLRATISQRTCEVVPLISKFRKI